MPSKTKRPKGPTPKKPPPFPWIIERLEDHPQFDQKKMFGCQALSMRGLLSLVLAEGEEPWNGLMVCTSREHHESLMKSFPDLSPHAVLGKWLYVSQREANFESIAEEIVERVRVGDVRIGVESKGKRKRST